MSDTIYIFYCKENFIHVATKSLLPLHSTSLSEECHIMSFILKPIFIIVQKSHFFSIKNQHKTNEVRTAFVSVCGGV